jgi:hypothetical protein
MKNLTAARVGCIAECRLDLLANGIDVAGMTPAQHAVLVGKHLEYFQLMLRDDSTPTQLLALIRRDSSIAARDHAKSFRLRGTSRPAAHRPLAPFPGVAPSPAARAPAGPVAARPGRLPPPRLTGKPTPSTTSAPATAAAT